MIKETIPLHQLEAGRVGVNIFRIASPDFLSSHHDEAVVPHRHDHYCCFFVEQGTVGMMVDFQQMQLPAGALLVSPPGHSG
jgi:AraC family transcriptional activator of pobA